MDPQSENDRIGPPDGALHVYMVFDDGVLNQKVNGHAA